MFGEEITSYQKEAVPKFVTQIKRYMPDMYEKVLQIDKSISDLASSVSYIGKYAKVKSLLPGKAKLGSNIVEWDGTMVRAKGNQISFWHLNKEGVIIVPNDDTCVEIYEDATVTENVQLKDE